MIVARDGAADPTPSIRRMRRSLRARLGFDHYDQRAAHGDNQFSLEPPDPGLCAKNSFQKEVRMAWS